MKTSHNDRPIQKMSERKRRSGLAVVVMISVAIVSLAGCQGMEVPNFSHPGSLKYQRFQAHRFDPYPEPGVGPAMPGTRPRSYSRPPAEPSRARWTLGARGGY